VSSAGSNSEGNQSNRSGRSLTIHGMCNDICRRFDTKLTSPVYAPLGACVRAPVSPPEVLFAE
jgi:hypothetical protein